MQWLNCVQPPLAFFNLVGDVALLLASVIAGKLWEAVGAPTTFIAGAGFVVIAALGLLLLTQPRHRNRHFHRVCAFSAPLASCQKNCDLVVLSCSYDL
jgi:hypothetical protein